MTEAVVNLPYVTLWAIDDSSIPQDMVKALCVDASGLLLKITLPRLLYRKQRADVLSFCENHNTYGALVSVSLTGRGITFSLPTAVSKEEWTVLDKIVDIVFNHPELILPDGRIPLDLVWAPQRMITTAVQYVEANRDYYLSQEQATLNQMSPADLQDSERKGIFRENKSLPDSPSCPKCGSKYTLGKQFCGFCGIKLP